MGNKPTINTKDSNLRDLLGNGKKYFVPKFQRDYSWENEQWQDLWNDIEFICDNVLWKNAEKACQVFFWFFLKLILVGSYYYRNYQQE